MILTFESELLKDPLKRLLETKFGKFTTKIYTYNLDLSEEIKYICKTFSTRSYSLPTKLGFVLCKYKFLIQADFPVCAAYSLFGQLDPRKSIFQ